MISRKNTATLIAVFCALSIGYGLGSSPEQHTLNYNYTEDWGASHEHHAFNPDRHVNYTGTIKVGTYTVHFQTESQNEKLEGRTIGYTYPGGADEIWIETKRSAAEIEQICDHEVFHEEFESFRHPEGLKKYSDPIYRYSDDARIWECDLATKIALEQQS